MSAIAEGGDASIEVIKVLFTLHPGMDALDFVGPLEVLTWAQHDVKDPATKAFQCTFAAAQEHTTTNQGCTFKAHIDFKEAQKRLKEFDVMVVPGGGTDEVLKTKSEPLQIIKAFADLQTRDPNRERTLMSVCTGSLFLGHMGILAGLSATTHPDYYTKFEIVCSEAAKRDLAERTDVLEERYVVNNLRFDLGENMDENPYIRRRSDGRRPSNARKGSNAWRESNTRRESNARRLALRLGGLRVITAGGITSGIDAALYLVGAMVSDDSAQEVARKLQHTWNKGVVVDGLNV
ncbi:hypothetical protein B0A49_01448 [Cryomyces minteri]|uniref:DJ-1/PfpI domain-containing protein n=1 Tax=Cryomyces minteri TaxID=331657 RepID=A0A4U0XKW8_9PEZI|nr:hypothetical protein B0A49_01448 [Cryomyces minteri]